MALTAKDQTLNAVMPGLARRGGNSLGEQVSRLAARYPLGIAGLAILLLMMVASILGDRIAPYDPLASYPADRLHPPSASYWFGTDEFGRDVLSRIIFGGRNSFIISVSAVVLGTIVGTTVGVISGYLGGRVDLVVQRIVDVIMSFPVIVLALLLMAALGSSLTSVVIAIAISLAPRTARIARGDALSVKQNLFVEAAVALGAPHRQIIWRHVLPNLIAPIVVFSSSQVGAAIILESSLSFLGAGVPPESPSWGRMLTTAARYAGQAPWLAIIPGVVLSLAVFSINVLGDAIRDVTDPRLRNVLR